MCGKYQKWRQNIKTPNSEKVTRDAGRGGGQAIVDRLLAIVDIAARNIGVQVSQRFIASESLG